MWTDCVGIKVIKADLRARCLVTLAFSIDFSCENAIMALPNMRKLRTLEQLYFLSWKDKKSYIPNIVKAEDQPMVKLSSITEIPTITTKLIGRIPGIIMYDRQEWDCKVKFDFGTYKNTFYYSRRLGFEWRTNVK